MTDTSNGTPNGRIRSAADSTTAIVFARFMMPGALAIIGSLMLIVLHNVEASINDARDATKLLWVQIDKVNGATTSTHEAVEVLISQFNAEQVDRKDALDGVNARLGDHEVRIRTLETKDGRIR